MPSEFIVCVECVCDRWLRIISILHGTVTAWTTADTSVWVCVRGVAGEQRDTRRLARRPALGAVTGTSGRQSHAGWLQREGTRLSPRTLRFKQIFTNVCRTWTAIELLETHSWSKAEGPKNFTGCIAVTPAALFPLHPVTSCLNPAKWQTEISQLWQWSLARKAILFSDHLRGKL